MKHVIEAYTKKLEEGNVSIEEMRDVLMYLRHERLVHLIVSVATGFLWFVICILMLLIRSIVTDIVFIGVTILFLLYIRYYCYLENSIQRLSDEALRLYEKK